MGVELVVDEVASFVSTRACALSYAPDMRTANIIATLTVLVLGCGPEVDHAEFGEACEPHGCADGLSCYIGYCEDECSGEADCSPVEGWSRECNAGLCHIVCDDQGACPQTLEVPLECGIAWCAAKDGS